MRTDVPAAWPLLALASGLALAPHLSSATAAAAGCGATALLLPIARRGRRWASLPLFVAGGLALAVAVQLSRASDLRSHAALDPDRFVVAEAPIARDWTSRGSSFVLRVETFRAGGHDYREPLAIYASFQPPAIGMEQHVRAEGFLRVNERGQFTMSVKSPVLLSYGGRLPWHSPAAWNRALANRLRPHAGRHPTEVALVEALVLGRGERLTDEVRDSFKRGGTYHLLVFSGMQIAFAAAFLALVLRRAGAPRASDWLLLAFSVAAPAFIGPAASVSRASIAIGLYSAARLLKRPTSIENLFCVAALGRLILEPRDLTDPSFHLTYAGAGALLFVGKAFSSRWIAHAAAAEIAITPLTLFHFHQYALGGSILTLAMSPLIFLALAVSAVACAVPSDTVFAVVGVLHRACVAMNEVVSPASGFFTAPPPWSMTGGFFAAGASIAWLRGRSRGLAVAAALLLPTLTACSLWAARRTVDSPQALFFDVGQGDSVAFRWGSHAVLVDGGGRLDDWRFGESHLLPLLVDRGITRLDRVMLTHSHPDHCAGLLAVFRHLRVGEVWISPRRFRGECASRLIDAIREARVPVRLVRTTRVAGDEPRFVALAPERTFRRSPDNNASMAIVIESGGRRVLVPGDAQAEREIDLSHSDIAADILKVAHHGSRSSSTRLFLDAVRPRIAIVTCGRRNLFGNPHPDVLEALRARGARIRRTDSNGTIEVTLSSGRIFVRPEIDTPLPRLVQ